MNIAYPAIVMFLLILPGIIYRKTLRFHSLIEQKTSFTDEISKSIFSAFVIQYIWLFICDKARGHLPFLKIPNVDLNIVFRHAIGNLGQTNQEINNSINAVTLHLNWAFVYFAGIYTFAYFCAFFVETIHNLTKHRVGWFQTYKYIHTLSNLFYQSNEPADKRLARWISLFSPDMNLKEDENGVLFLENDNDGMNSDVLSIIEITAIVEFGKTAFIIRGQLSSLEDSIEWDEDGDPDRFILKCVSRRPLLDSELNDNKLESKNEDGFYDIFGDLFVLWTCEIKTLNIVYYLLPFEYEITNDSLIQQDDVRNESMPNELEFSCFDKFIESTKLLSINHKITHA